MVASALPTNVEWGIAGVPDGQKFEGGHEQRKVRGALGRWYGKGTKKRREIVHRGSLIEAGIVDAVQRLVGAAILVVNAGGGKGK